MLVQDKDRPLWHANYKSMSTQQLVAELQNIAQHPHFYDNRIARTAYITNELSLPRSRMVPIILMEAETETETEPTMETTMSLQIIDGPIFQAGATLSEGIDISAGNIVRITTPDGWTPANMTFQISTDGGGYNDLYDAEGNEITIVVRGDNSAIIVRDDWSRHINWIKFRSGTAKHPVPQEQGRLFAVAVEVRDAPVGAAAGRADDGRSR